VLGQVQESKQGYSNTSGHENPLPKKTLPNFGNAKF
jgi:hypothetical protein